MYRLPLHPLVFTGTNGVRPRVECLVLLAAVLVLPLNKLAAASPAEDIGTFVDVHGAVSVLHPAASSMIPAVPHEMVRFRDIIQTQQESQTRALFDDDSLLTVGEHSRVEITEYVYDPDRRHRNVIVKLVQGTLRSLVSKVLAGAGSRFEIHTPTAIAAARGTYFVVWTDGTSSGVANIGESGRVDFSAGGATVTLLPHQFSTVEAGATPTMPAAVDSGAPAVVGTAVAATDFRPGPRKIPPGKAIAAMSGAQVLAGKPEPGAPSILGPSAVMSSKLPPGLAGTTPGQSGMTPGEGGVSPAPPFTVSAPATAGSITAGGPPCGTPPCGNAFGQGKKPTDPGPPLPR